MTKNTTDQKKTRNQYSQNYKDEALALAERIGLSKAATQLGLQESQLYYWKNKRRHQQTVSEREQLLADENVRLKRLLAEQTEELAIVKKAAAYFAKNQK
jgi:transposase